MYLLGIDLGTTGCKSMVFDENGAILGSNYIEYDLIICKDGIEQDAGAWWNNVVNTVRASIKQSGVSGSEIAALSVSSQGIAFVPVDINGNTLMNAISWLDTRSTEETAFIKCVCGEKDIFLRTGKTLLPCYVLPQLMWIRRHRPEVYDKTFKVLMAHDYIVYRMTGKTVTDLSMASGTLAYDIHEQKWMPELLTRFDIDIDKLPDLMVFGDVAGTVLPKVAEELGISHATKVVIGAQDQRCASIGAGIDKGIFTISLGTSSAIGAICDRPLIDKTMQVTCCGLDRGRWILETVVATAGVALKWLKNIMFPDLSYMEMDRMAEAAKPLAGGVRFYPHLMADASGEAKGSFTGLSLQTTPQDLIRAVLEGVAYQMRIHIGNMERIGVVGDEIRLFGGGATSGIWCRIISDITGKRVVVPATHETANLGAAIIAGVGAGMFADFNDAGRMVGKPGMTVIPDEENMKIYNEAYTQYEAHNAGILSNS